jgi:hypothetical protein
MKKNNKYIYRYFSLPSNILSSLQFDNINYNSKLTINSILQTKQDSLKSENNSYANLSEPYFSLYKINYLLHEKMLYLSKLEDFNDPFEEFVWYQINEKDVANSLNQHGKKPKPKKLNRILKRQFPNGTYTPFYYMTDKYYGLTSFCASYQDPRMWGYYSNGARGICIEFEVHQDLANIFETRIITGAYNKGENDTKRTYLFGKMNYNSELYNLNSTLIDKLKSKSIENPDLTGLDEYILTNLLTKSPVWVYEQEIRLIMLGQSRPIFLDHLISYQDHQPFLKIKKIIFGCKMEEEIKRIIKNSVSSDLSIEFAEIKPKEGEYTFRLEKSNFKAPNITPMQK